MRIIRRFSKAAALCPATQHFYPLLGQYRKRVHFVALCRLNFRPARFFSLCFATFFASSESLRIISNASRIISPR
jgi:hypothetical protein